MNYLEQLAAEWYRFSGYFVRTNVHAKKLKRGGFQNEIDVLAYKPKTGELIHIETARGMGGWNNAEKNIKKKFNIEKAEYERLVDAPVKKISGLLVTEWSKPKKESIHLDFEIRFKSTPQFLEEILSEIHKTPYFSASIPENSPILRTIQMMHSFYDAQMYEKENKK